MVGKGGEMTPLQVTRQTVGSFSDGRGPSSAAADKRGAALAEEGRSTCQLTQSTHLFEAERHGEHAHTHDAVHHVHDEARVGRRHCEAAKGKSSVSKSRPKTMSRRVTKRRTSER